MDGVTNERASDSTDFRRHRRGRSHFGVVGRDIGTEVTAMLKVDRERIILAYAVLWLRALGLTVHE